MAHLLISEDFELGGAGGNNDNYIEDYLEEFVKGFEILKLRIGKLKSYSTELDQMVAANNQVDNVMYRETQMRGRDF